MHYSDIETRARIARHKRRIFHQAGRLLVRWREHTVVSIGSICAHVSTLVGWLVGASGNLEKSPPRHRPCNPTTRRPIYMHIFVIYIYIYMYVRARVYIHTRRKRSNVKAVFRTCFAYFRDPCVPDVSCSAELPSQGPSIHGLRRKYRIDDMLRLNCTSGRSKPAANLTWYINDRQVRFAIWNRE